MIFVLSFDVPLRIDVATYRIGRLSKKFGRTDLCIKITGPFDFKMDLKILCVTEWGN